MTLESKTFGRLEIKYAYAGECEAVVSTVGIVDRDFDVVLPGAIKDGSTVKVSAYNHDTVLSGAPPAGLGVVRIRGETRPSPPSSSSWGPPAAVTPSKSSRKPLA